VRCNQLSLFSYPTMIAVYTITSGLHDEAAVSRLSDAFLSGIFPDGDFIFRGSDFSDFGTHTLDLIYVRTGGAEGIFKALLPEMLARGIERYYLLTSGKSNSLAASLEILSYLRQQGLKGEVLHGADAYVAERIRLLASVQNARARLKDMRVGVIGQPSDWLIASRADPIALLDKLGVRMVEVPMEELLVEIDKAAGEPAPAEQEMARKVRDAYPGAVKIYNALKVLVERHRLDAFTLRCFDLLTTVGNTGCLALSCFNSEGVPASCEGDVPALVSMMISHALTGVSGFQANPAQIDAKTGRVLFAHCTIPFNMVEDWQFDTHFESGIGVGIHGVFPEGPVTVFKVSGDLKRHFIAEGELIGNQYEPNLCRTQVILQLKPEDARYFLTDPIGNHHIIIPGRCKAVLEELL
jgi:L-fucose isomerase and related proteins